MKRIATSVFKVLLVIVLFTGGSVAVSTTGVKTVSEANAATYNQVYEYLLTHGYTVITLAPDEGGPRYQWTAHTVLNQVHYTTIITCTETCVVGNTDVAM